MGLFKASFQRGQQQSHFDHVSGKLLIAKSIPRNEIFEHRLQFIVRFPYTDPVKFLNLTSRMATAEDIASCAHPPGLCETGQYLWSIKAPVRTLMRVNPSKVMFRTTPLPPSQV